MIQKLILLSVLNSCCILLQAQKALLASTVEQRIRSLEYKAFDAEFRLDTATLSKMMDEKFIAVYPRTISNKQQELAGIYKNISQMKRDEHFIDSFYLDDFKVQLYDYTAVATFFSVTKGRIKAVPFENKRWRWTDVWVKRKGEWKFVSSQGMKIWGKK